EPQPLAQAGAPDVPDELERIVAKAIAKDPDERYQTAKDMLIDLRNLRKRVELDAEIERSSAFAQEAITTKENAPAARTAEPAVVESSKTNHSVVIGLIVIGAVVAGIIGFTTWRALRNRSVVPPVTPVASAPEPRLAYWITVQKFKDGKPYQDPFDLASEINFEADYQIRLSIRAVQPGYLYVLNEGPAKAGSVPEYVVIFPSPTANEGSEFVAANQRVQIPNQTWLKFDKEQGVEKLWLVFSEQAVPELAGVKAFANARTRGLITDAQQNNTINSFLASHSFNKVGHETGDRLTTLTSPLKTLVYPIRLEHH
ncbi:MAG TPA: DUF4384 domain-containing protein, partial [Pyrinomonadaceae bacterium]|nr:DUF4384 domain-containing protein [Pyrinomonadaceae bacterium]